MFRRVAAVEADVVEESIAPIIRVKRIGELGTMLSVTTNRRVFLHSVLQLLVTANDIPSLPIFVTLMMEAKRSSKTSVLRRATRRNITEDGGILLHFTFDL
jgi:hypothetical protein